MSATAGPTKDLALVLRTIRHGETSRIATLFGATLGKTAVLAKGARSGKAGAVGGALDPPCLAEMIIHIKASRSVQLLAQTAVVDAFHGIKGDVSRTAFAAVVCELLMKGFADGEASRPSFDCALKAFRALDAGVPLPHLALWEYLLTLTTALGFAIDAHTCPICARQPAEIGFRNVFWLDAGAVCCHGCRPDSGNWASLSGEAVGVLRLLARGGTTSRLRVSSVAAEELTGVLARHLRHHHPGYTTLPSLDMLGRLTNEG